MNRRDSHRPTDLPELRAEIVRFADSDIVWQMGAGLIQRVSANSAGAELFFVADSMVDLAMAAKDSLPDFLVEPDDVPAAFGVCYFAKPMCTYEVENRDGRRVPSRVVGAAWMHIDGRLGVAWLIDRDFFVGNSGWFGPLVSQLPRLWPIEAHEWTWEREDGAVVPPWGRLFMKSVWLLMQQPVAATEDATYDRTTRKRLARQHIEPAPVRVISLRRPASTGGAGESDREWQHQWIVRGHWRQQWYPARQVHRPLWIAPHVKGPEGKPFLGGDKVYHWRR